MGNLMQIMEAAKAQNLSVEQSREASRGAGEAASFVEVGKRKAETILEKLAQKLADEASEAGTGMKRIGNIGKALSLIPGWGNLAGLILSGIGDVGFALEQKKAYKTAQKDARLRTYEGTRLDKSASEIKGQFGEYAGAIDPFASGLSGVGESYMLGELGEEAKGWWKELVDKK